MSEDKDRARRQLVEAVRRCIEAGMRDAQIRLWVDASIGEVHDGR